jgi:hypothetical protein
MPSEQPYPPYPLQPYSGRPYPPQQPYSPVPPLLPPQAYLPWPPQLPPLGSNPHHVGARGFAQIFGLHPAIAFLTFVVDWMIFAADWGTVGAFWPVSVAVGVVLGIIAYKAQMKWYGDDRESALIKALILAFLTAIPVPLPAFLSVPAGIMGLFRHKT